jgi:hypothetical protein
MLEEIRVRALNNVVSKLEYGFISEKELIARKDLVVKLLDWFSFETFPEAEKILNLILRLIKVRFPAMVVDRYTSQGQCHEDEEKLCNACCI